MNYILAGDEYTKTKLWSDSTHCIKVLMHQNSFQYSGSSPGPKYFEGAHRVREDTSWLMSVSRNLVLKRPLCSHWAQEGETWIFLNGSCTLCYNIKPLAPYPTWWTWCQRSVLGVDKQSGRVNRQAHSAQLLIWCSLIHAVEELTDRSLY